MLVSEHTCQIMVAEVENQVESWLEPVDLVGFRPADLDQVDDPSSQSKEDLHLYIVIFAFWDSLQSTFY